MRAMIRRRFSGRWRSSRSRRWGRPGGANPGINLGTGLHVRPRVRHQTVHGRLAHGTDGDWLVRSFLQCPSSSKSYLENHHTIQIEVLLFPIFIIDEGTMVKVSGIWGRLVRLEGLLACLAVALGTPLFAQRYRLADPVVMPVKGNGWTVDTARGALIGCFPVQTLPGPMPVSLSVRLSGTYSHQEGTVAIGTAGTSPNTLGTISSTSSVATAFPIHALVHFGYIGGGGWAGNADVPIAYVLEDGTQYMDADFGTGADPNTKFVYPQLNNTSEGSGTVTYFLDAFGLGRTPTQLVPRYSNDLLAATYVANLTDLGSRGSAVQSLNPSGFDASSSSPTSWTILLTSDKARVFTYISDFAAWVPVMWIDKYGHTVTFQWTKSTANLPAGYSAVYSLKVLEPVAGLSAYQYPGFCNLYCSG